MTTQIVRWEKNSFYERNTDGIFKTTGEYLQRKRLVVSCWRYISTSDLYPETQTPRDIEAAAMAKAKNIMESHLKYDGFEATSQLWLAGVHMFNQVKYLETSRVQSVVLGMSLLFLGWNASQVGATLLTLTYLASGCAMFSYAGHKIATSYRMQDKKATLLMIGTGVLGVGVVAWYSGLSLSPLQGLWDLGALGVYAVAAAATTCLVGKMVLPPPRILSSASPSYSPKAQVQASWKRFKEIMSVGAKVYALKKRIDGGSAALNGLDVLAALEKLDKSRSGSKTSWQQLQKMSFLAVIDQWVYQNMSISWVRSEQMERVGNLKDKVNGQSRFEPATQ